MAPDAETRSSLILVTNCILISAFFGCYTDCKNMLHGTNDTIFVTTYVRVDVLLTDWLPKANGFILKCLT